ncbi:MAG: SGNH/GDSL hydrolase family protein [Steroidobacteraceae bacterium]
MKRRYRVWALVAAGVVLLALLGSRLWLGWYMRASANPEFFEDEIADFAAADRDHPPPERPIVFVGSSSVRLWKTLQADMAPLPVLNRGFGGAQMSHVVYFADRAVIQYRPRAVVVYAGDNDLDQRTGKSADDVVRDFRTFVARVQAAVPDTRIYYISIKPSRLRWGEWPEQQKANMQISALCAADPHLGYIDIATPMLAVGKPPPRDLFRLDGLHLSKKGYALWTGIIKPRLQVDFQGTIPSHPLH